MSGNGRLRWTDKLARKCVANEFREREFTHASLWDRLDERNDLGHPGTTGQVKGVIKRMHDDGFTVRLRTGVYTFNTRA